MKRYMFRGKRKDNNKWTYGSLMNDIDQCMIYVYGTGEMHRVFAATVGQNTGLKDKNGIDIYEGDILRGFQKEQSDKEGRHGFETTDTVYYRAGGFIVFGKNMQSGYTRDNNILFQFMWCNRGHYATPDSYYQLDDIEVLGNIHDVNPPADSPALNTMHTDPAAKQEATNEQVTELESAAQDQAMEVDSEEGTTEG